MGAAAVRLRAVAGCLALLDADFHLELAARREVGDHVVGIDDLDVVVGLDVRGRDDAFARLGEAQHHVVAIV